MLLSRLASAIRSRLPRTATGWVLLASGVLSWVVALGMVAFVVKPLFRDLHGYGRHDWDQMESHRYLVRKAIRLFHEFPFWNPYACGGHPAWGGFESDTTVVAPWLPAYLALSLPVAMRVEIAASAAWGAIGAWLLASRFTRSHAARAFVAVVFAVNGRWTLQLVAGHTWHMVYAWMPWALFLFDRAVGAQPALGPPRPRDAVWTGVCLAMMVYTGGIYPLPQTAVVLGVYAAILAATMRSARPLFMLAAAGATSVGLSAPKLLPILEVMHRYARAIDSPESLTPEQLMELLTDPVQGFAIGHAGIGNYTWHEVGMYLGWPVLVLLGVGVIAGRGLRVFPLKAMGLVLAAFGLGSFSPWSPWALAHRLPIFSSQHVPYRWLYPALLLLACVAVAAFERALGRVERWRAAIEVVALVAVAWIARDVGTVARYPLESHMAEAGPTVAESVGPFHTEQRTPTALNYEPGDWAPATLGTEMANIGTIECNTFHGLNNFGGLATVVPGYDGKPTGLAAHGVGEADYHGEVYVADGGGTAIFARWAPSSFDVQVDGVRPGATVVVNQNWDPGWSVDGAQAVDYHGTIAAHASESSQTLHFRYRPRSWWAGIAVFAATLVALFYVFRQSRKLPARSRALRTGASFRADAAPPSAQADT